MCDLRNKIFFDETKAREWLEAQRWPDGPVCPYCGEKDRVSAVKPETMRNKATGEPTPGWYHCNACRKRFTVRVGTLYERSHIPLHTWLAATHLLAASKKGISTHQLHRMLGVTYKSAWFMAHRIREGMMATNDGPLGGDGSIVEADETYFGKRETPIKRQRKDQPYKPGKRRGGAEKRSIVSLVERGGKVRTFHVQHATAASIRQVLVRNVSRKTTLHTDESRLYTETGKEFAAHETVRHSSGEYVRGVVHTNTVENVFSVFKRGMRGVYQHCGEAHLFRYLAEFDFRYNNRKISDAERAAEAVR